MFKRVCYLIFLIEALLGVAHILWPEYRWGQGRRSYFNFGNSQTLASWLASMQLAGIALFALVGFHRERLRQKGDVIPTIWFWPIGALIALVMSIAEMTRIHHRLNLLGFPAPDIYELFITLPLGAFLIIVFGWFLLHRLKHLPNETRYALGWLTVWGGLLFLKILTPAMGSMADSRQLEITLCIGLAHLMGITLLLTAVGGLVLQPVDIFRPPRAMQKETAAPFPQNSGRIWILLGVGGTAFAVIFLQIILFQILTIFSDYLTAHSVISIVLLGISGGGLIGFFSTRRAPLETMIGASLLFPVSILVAFGAAVSLIKTPLAASILLMLPFVCGSTVITVALARAESHRVYFIDLLGAAFGALLVSTALGHFREESSLLFLGAFTFLLAGCFIVSYPNRRVRIWLFLLMLSGASGFFTTGSLNLELDRLNIVRTKILGRYPNAQVLFSKSSFVGRYDVVRRNPKRKTLKAFENGHVTDTISNRPPENYQIDPRVPHTLMKDPVILILGLSGDGITKTARSLGKKVYGVEINPAVVDLQTHALKRLNADSYRNIDVTVKDARSFVEQSRQQYDMITLMNAHRSRGRTAGRAPSPEYLHTREAITSYLDHLTDRGVLIVEEPVSRPRREPPVWKLLVTMRRALLDRGSMQPERHFFVFQWKTKRNNYVQILIKKTPFTGADIDNLRQWLREVDDIKNIESVRGRRMGPISAKTTLLYSPDEYFSNTYFRMITGTAHSSFLRARNLVVTTDDRPFHFDVDPAHPRIRASYGRALIMAALFSPFILFFLGRYRSQLRSTMPYIYVVGLTGLGYLLIEVVLIQRYEIFLGSPIVTFSSVLGTLLIFSGLGSLWSGRIAHRRLWIALGALLVFLILHLRWIPVLLAMGAFLKLPWKATLAVISIAPLAFFMGVPFPYVLRGAKAKFSGSAAAFLFAVNAAAGAVAVPLALNLSTAWGLDAVFLVSILIYLAAGISLVATLKNRILGFTNWGVAVFLILVLAAPWFLNRPVQTSASDRAYHRVFGVSYGRSHYRQDKIVRGGSASKRVAFEWIFWIIRSKDRTILVDTGFDDPNMANRYRIRKFTQPTARLHRLGISPDEISDVILTHAHWDHMGSLSPFKNAKIWIQEKEYRHIESILGNGKSEAGGMRSKDLKTLFSAEQEGRVNRIRGEVTLLPGITLTPGGSHTPGFQYVTVETLDGPVIIAGDSTYLYQNNLWHRPIGDAVDYHDNLETIQKMHRHAASPFYILPGHDPRVMKWFPKISNGIVEITSVAE